MKVSRRSCIAGSLGGLALIIWGGTGPWTRFQQARLASQEYDPPPPGMVFVPAGPFLMGSDDPHAEPDERPLRKVFVPAFYIDRFEVTNRRYQALVPTHSFPQGEDDLPATFVLKQEAEEFCRRAGRRLPTSPEWEKAARGVDGQVYPWGNDFRTNRANVSRRAGSSQTNVAGCKSPNAPSTGKLLGGSFPSGVSPYGCHDMAGNVWEWVHDVWVDPHWLGMKTSGADRGILRGGASSYSPLQARTSYQGFEALGATCHDVGFRCAMQAVAKTQHAR